MITQFTTPDGIITFEADHDEVRIIYRADDGPPPLAIVIPRFKFNWFVADYLKSKPNK